jgi:hypothetical protein
MSKIIEIRIKDAPPCELRPEDLEHLPEPEPEHFTSWRWFDRSKPFPTPDKTVGIIKV